MALAGLAVLVKNEDPMTVGLSSAMTTPPRASKEYLSTHMMRQESYSIADYFEEVCDLYPSRPALIYVGCERFPERCVSFRELEEESNKVAHWAVQHGLRQHDVCALYMENRIEYVVTWLGLCKAGVSVAFVNNTIRKKPLIHSIAISNAKLLLFGIECEGAIKPVHERLLSPRGVQLFCIGGSTSFAPELAAATMPVARLDRLNRSTVKLSSVFGFVYTSGTTGLPKAVRVTHLKQWTFGSKYRSHGVNANDVLYSCGMPLYHSSASGIGTGMVMHYGCCQVLRKRFSAKAFLSDIRKYNATVVQYIGEICRYICNQPRSAADRENSLRLATGNGLSKDIWIHFQKRFGIKRIVEFYGSTEGNGAFQNVVELKSLERGDTSGVGCIGKVDPKKSPPIRFVRYDVENETLCLDDGGHLVDCGPGEPGECLMPIVPSVPATAFVGYTDPQASAKKVIEDRGVSYVRTGDLLSVDRQGWIRFVDRLGDTFRWKGENVSTSEVASELSLCELVAEANVFGVKVPHEEGRAGMAAIVFKDTVSSDSSVTEALGKVLAHARKHLPSYAVPMFVRVQRKTDTTGTLKHRKGRLRREGVDPQFLNGDSLWWLRDGASETYAPFRESDFVSLKNRHEKLSRL